MRVYSIVTIKDIIGAIESGVIEGKEYLDSMKSYLEQYGAQY